MNLCAPLSLVLVLLSSASPQTLEDLVQRNSDFGARLYRAVSGRTDDNVLLSPLALTTGLVALLTTAQGPTQDQILQGLTLSGLDPQALLDQFQSLRGAVLQGARTSNLQQGVGLFPAETFQVPQSLADLVQTKLGGTARTVAFSSPADAVDSINRWAQEQTGDQVTELVTNLDSQTQLLLASADAYQARFSPAFNSTQSQVERFYVDRYHVVMVPLMTRTDKYFLAYDRSVKAGVLKLAMSDGAAMLVVFPDEGVDVGAVEEELSAEKIQAWIRQLKKTKLEVQVPRFLLERSYSLRDVLRTFNITQVFQDDADIINLGGAKGPTLSQVSQKSVVSVDERSDDIITGGGVNLSASPPPRLTINRPFVFIVYHQETGSLLLIGRVVDPTRK